MISEKFTVVCWKFQSKPDQCFEESSGCCCYIEKIIVSFIMILYLSLLGLFPNTFQWTVAILQIICWDPYPILGKSMWVNQRGELFYNISLSLMLIWVCDNHLIDLLHSWLYNAFELLPICSLWQVEMHD